MKLREALAYDDVLLVPRYSDIKSRQEVNIGNSLDDNIYLDLPIISSPMDTVSESSMAAAMAKNGGMAVIHRYNSIDEQCKHVECLPAEAVVAGAIGVTGDFE